VKWRKEGRKKANPKGLVAKENEALEEE